MGNDDFNTAGLNNPLISASLKALLLESDELVNSADRLIEQIERGETQLPDTHNTAQR